MKSELKGHLASFTAYLIFGINLVLCKDIANSQVIAPIALFSVRAAGATALFWLVSLFLPKERIDRRDIGKIVIASALGLFITQYTFLQGICMATAIDTAILATLSPVFTMFVAAIFLKEPITLRKAGGVVISFAGVILLILNSVHSGGADVTRPAGVLLLIINSLSFALYLGIFRPLIQKYSVVTFMKWMFLFSLLMSLPFSWRDLCSVNYSGITPQVGMEIGFLVIFATFVAYFLIPVGQKYIRPTLVNMYSYVQPIIAATIAIATGIDHFTWQKALATVMVFTGVALVNGSRKARNAASGN